MLSTKVNTHYAILVDGRQIAMTTEQARQVYKMKADPNITGNRFVNLGSYTGELNKIKEIIETPKVQSGTGYYCDFGNFHSINDTCNCPNIYRMDTFTFAKKIAENYPNIQYPQQITEQMRQSILN